MYRGDLPALIVSMVPLISIMVQGIVQIRFHLHNKINGWFYSHRKIILQLFENFNPSSVAGAKCSSNSISRAVFFLMVIVGDFVSRC